MPSSRKRALTVLVGAALLILVGFDLTMTHNQRSYLSITELSASQEGRPLVALATSEDLSPAIALDNPAVSYDQVKELVYLALDRDSSPGALRHIVSADEWVGIKVNMVSAPLIIKDRKIGGFWNGKVDGAASHVFVEKLMTMVVKVTAKAHNRDWNKPCSKW